MPDMSPAPKSTPPVLLLSTSTVHPTHKSTLEKLKLSTSDLPMLSCHYIQKGCLYTSPPSLSSTQLATHLKKSLALALTHFPPLAGRLTTDPSSGHVYITCNDAGALFIQAESPSTHSTDLLSTSPLPQILHKFFAFHHTVSFSGHHLPLAVLQITHLADAVFLGFTVNHAVVDGTSFWNFFNTFAEISRGVRIITKHPVLTRCSINSPLMSDCVLRLPPEGPSVTFDADSPLRERIFNFTKESILLLKSTANRRRTCSEKWVGKIEVEGVSSFQALCSLLWRGVTRARRLPSWKKTTMRMAVNCRPRVVPKMGDYYFGNAIQSIATCATVGEVLGGGGLGRCAEELNRSVREHWDGRVRRVVEEWESEPRCFPLGNFDGAMITVGSSPRFPMYENDLGWGRPVAVRSGGANKFDGKVSAFPGREGGGSVDLEVCLSPDTMSRLELDDEFMHYVLDPALVF